MKISNYRKVNRCPLCNSKNIAKKGNLKYSDNVNFSSNEIQITYLPELWKCKQCQSNFVQYTVDAETAKKLYSNGQAFKRWSIEAFDKCKIRNMIDTMSEIFRNKGNVLDVGCNTGELLDFARVFGCKTSGLEFSSASRKILTSKGHKPFASIEDLPGGYDVITAFDLVEHLYDLPSFLKSCHMNLTDNGQLIILTGNIRSLSATLSGSGWWYAQYPEHIVFPSKKFFSKYSGFRVNKWILTYASKDYQSSIFTIGWKIMKGVLRRGYYSGLPSIGPDHILVVLNK